MFIVTVNGDGSVVDYFVPPSPRTIDAYEGDPLKIYIDRSQFTSDAHLVSFKRNYKKYSVVNGRLTRTQP